MRPGDRKPDCGNKLVPAAGAERLNRELLQWLPGETLFGLVRRLHRLRGHRLADQTADVLFGRRRQGYRHDVPSGLHEFEQNTAGLLGDVWTIARERTLLRYDRPFLTPATVDGAIARMAGPSVARLKCHLGLQTSRFGAHHPLKACPERFRAPREDRRLPTPAVRFLAGGLFRVGLASSPGCSTIEPSSAGYGPARQLAAGRPVMDSTHAQACCWRSALVSNRCCSSLSGGSFCA